MQIPKLKVLSPTTRRRNSSVSMDEIKQTARNMPVLRVVAYVGLIYATVAGLMLMQHSIVSVVLPEIQDVLQTYIGSDKLRALEILYRTRLQAYQSTGLDTGIISRRPERFFDSLRDNVDALPNRCVRYGVSERDSKVPLYWSALVSDRPSWELYESVSAETKHLYAGIIMVDPQQTIQNVTKLEELFGTTVQVATNEEAVAELWKKLGVTSTDIVIQSNLDLTFSRDALWALRECDVGDCVSSSSRLVQHSCLSEGGSTLHAQSWACLRDSKECTCDELELHQPGLSQSTSYQFTFDGSDCKKQAGIDPMYPLYFNDPEYRVSTKKLRRRRR